MEDQRQKVLSEFQHGKQCAECEQEAAEGQRNTPTGSGLQNVSKRQLKGSGIRPEVCCCPGGAIVFSLGPLKKQQMQGEAFSGFPLSV